MSRDRFLTDAEADALPVGSFLLCHDGFHKGQHFFKLGQDGGRGCVVSVNRDLPLTPYCWSLQFRAFTCLGIRFSLEWVPDQLTQPGQPLRETGDWISSKTATGVRDSKDGRVGGLPGCRIEPNPCPGKGCELRSSGLLAAKHITHTTVVEGTATLPC